MTSINMYEIAASVDGPVVLQEPTAGSWYCHFVKQTQWNGTVRTVDGNLGEYVGHSSVVDEYGEAVRMCSQELEFIEQDYLVQQAGSLDTL